MESFWGCQMLIYLTQNYLTYLGFINKLKYLSSKRKELSMQMEINLDRLFGTSANNKNQETHQDSSCNSSMHSDPYPHDKSFDYHFQLKKSIFDDEVQSCIMSEQDHEIKSHSKHTSAQQNHEDSIITSSQMSGGYSIPQNAMPGQRLYYQSKNNMIRKKQQIQRIKLERIARQQHQNTFKPNINKRSEKLAKTSKNSPLLSTQATFKHKESKILKQEPMPSFVKKQMDSLNQCTFKPKLIAKSSTHLPNRNKDQVFWSLYNQHKIKDAKLRLRSEEQEQPAPKSKKLSKKELEQFLDRNNQYLNKVNKKNQLLVKTSKQFDLQTGQRLFTPTTSNNPKGQKNCFTSSKAQKQQKSSSNIPENKSIFGKNRNYEQEQSEQNKYFKNYGNDDIEEMEYVETPNTPINAQFCPTEKYSSKGSRKKISIDQIPNEEDQESDSQQQLSQIPNKQDNDEPSLNYFEKINKSELVDGSLEEEGKKQDRSKEGQERNVLIFQISDVHKQAQNS